MLIRSQNKKNIINIDNICHFEIRAKETKIHEINALENSGLIISIAEYSTEEKAVKVLDMIEDYYVNETHISCDADGFGVAYNQNSVFKMPKDEEVEV